MSSDFFIPDPEGLIPSAEGYFGAYGGKFIPEALVAAVDEVAVEYEKAKSDPAFAAELGELMVHYTGKPSALTEVPRFAEHMAAPGSSSSARTSTTPARTRSTTCWGRPC